MSDNSKAEPVVKETKKLKSKKSTESNQDPSDEKKPPPKPAKAKLYSAMSDHMNRIVKPFSGADIFPEFPGRFLLYKQKNEPSQYLELKKDDIVEIVEDVAIIDSIVKFTREKLAGNPHFEWEQRHAVDCYKYWKAATYSLTELIPAYSWKTQPGYTFHRLPWDMPQAPYNTCLKRAPLWYELMGRITNKKALMMFIGSLFDEKSYRQQYAWIVGKGGQGKGAILEFLQYVFGSAYHMEEAPAATTDNEGAKHWTMGLQGKRVVAFDDCERPAFVSSGLFKRVTGNKSVRGEPKHVGHAFTLKLIAKFIFTSQKYPEIDDEEANTRRLLLFEISPLPENHKRTDTYQEDLQREGGVFLEVCIGLYEQWKTENPNISEIPLKKDSLEKVSGSADEEFETFFKNNLTYVEGIGTAASVVYPKLQNAFGSNLRIGKAKGYLKRKHNIEYIRLNKIWVYTNMRLKSLPGSSFEYDLMKNNLGRDEGRDEGETKGETETVGI